jgi:uncharacterized membrane protein YdjX (TVP38/TMEM64 family)
MFNIEEFAYYLLDVLQHWGFVLVIVFAIMHPLFENPLALFNLTLGIAILGIPLAYGLIFVSNVIGIMILWLLANKANKKTDYFLLKKQVSKKALDWIKETPLWKHIIVIGVPMIPTYPIKVAVPLSGVTFKEYMVTLVGAYVFLFLGNTLLYFGVFGVFLEGIHPIVSFVLLLTLVLYIYFGNKLFKGKKSKAI